MSKEREMEAKLAAEFPFMRRGRSLEEQYASDCVDDLYSAFGIEADEGWYELLRDLCREITEAYDRAGAPVDIVIDQIKEKFGTLRFYYHRDGEQAGIQAIDCMDGSGLRLSPKADDELSSALFKIVSKYEEKSATVCEHCGRAGCIRDDLPWIQTLCEECYGKRLERMKVVGTRPFPPKD